MPYSPKHCPHCSGDLEQKKTSWGMIFSIIVPILIGSVGVTFTYGQLSASLANLKEESAMNNTKTDLRLGQIDRSRQDAIGKRNDLDKALSATLANLNANVTFLSQQVAGIQDTLRIRAQQRR